MYTFHSWLVHKFFLCIGTIKQQHNPENDARVSIRLFNKYYANPALKTQDEKKLIERRPQPSFVKLNGYAWEGVCMAAFMPEKCSCGAPTLHKTKK